LGSIGDHLWKAPNVARWFPRLAHGEILFILPKDSNFIVNLVCCKKLGLSCPTNTTNTGWWIQPSEKYESQLGLSFAIYGKMKNVTNHQPDLLECYMRLRWIHAYRERAPHATCTQMPADAGRLGIRTMQQNHQLSIFAPAGLSQLVVLDLGTATRSSSH
jgi:hypothetical protein